MVERSQDHPTRRFFLKSGLRLGAVILFGTGAYDAVTYTGPAAQKAIDDSGVEFSGISTPHDHPYLDGSSITITPNNPKYNFWMKLRADRGISRREGIDAIALILGLGLATLSIPDWFKPTPHVELSEEVIDESSSK